MRRLIWLPVAGFLLIAGAAVAAAAPTFLDRAQSTLQAEASPVPSSTPSTSGTEPGATRPFGLKGAAEDILNKVLSDLVADGTITQEQADAITNGLKTEIANRQAELEQLRQQWQETRGQLKTFLKDGVITQDEIDTLPADNPLRIAFDSIAENGQVTVDQLRDFLPFGGEYLHRGPGSFGHGFWGDEPGTPNEEQPSESAAPSATP
jgi:polyhydroxyalkanoate synthesis regulator phasin